MCTATVLVRNAYEVVKLKLGKSIIESSLDRLGVMLGVPELRSDEDVFTLDAELLECALDTLSDFFLVLVAGWWNISSASFSGIKKAIASRATPPPHRGAPGPIYHGVWRFAGDELE